MFLRTVVGILLAAHGLVHLLFLVTDPDDPNFPFTIEEWWLTSREPPRRLGIGLITVTIAASTLAAFGVWGVPGLASVWAMLTIVAAGLSTVLLVVYWDTQLFLGILINMGLIVIAALQPSWTERLGG